MGNCVAFTQEHLYNPTNIFVPKIRVVGRPSSPPIPSMVVVETGRVLNRPLEDINQFYVIGRRLGRGEFGVTYSCIHKLTHETFACKSISKLRLTTQEDIDDVRRELEIMHHVSGTHPNIVNLEGQFEDKKYVHFVMELCEGGELFDRIILKGKFTERATSSLCRTMVEVIGRCHSLGVIHRDIKPENFLFLTKEEDSPLKTIDFGLSVFFKPGEIFTEIVGTPIYMAPEVIQRSYGPESDIWSVGVVLYVLLSGAPPFYAENEEGILRAIIEKNLDLQSDPWPFISGAAKDLVKKMLIKDPKERITVNEILNHSWVRVDGDASDKLLDSIVLERMKQFTAMNKLKRLALKVIAQSLTEEEIKGLKEMFKSMDTDNSGTITYDELKRGLAMQGADLTELEVQQLMESADVDGNGHIDYMEFITATMHMNKMDQEERLLAAFRYFDRDHSGYITMDMLEQALVDHNMGDREASKDIIAEVDTDNDGRINYVEFAAMMRKGTPHQKRRRHGHIKDSHNEI